jgi:hypothetical protein
VHARGGQLLQVHRLDDVDAAFHQQHPVRGQERVPLAGWQALERDRVGTRRVHAPLGEPARARLAHPGDAGVVAQVLGRVRRVEAGAPAAADQRHVTRAGRAPLAFDGRVEVRRGDLVAGRAGRQAECRRHVEQHAAPEHRRDGLRAECVHAATALRVLGVEVAEQHAVVRHVGERVDVRADVGAE